MNATTKREPLFQTLRRQRKVHKYSVQKLSELLKSHNIHVAPKTIYNWETGQSKPSLDVLFALMEIYNIPELLGLPNALSKAEVPEVLPQAPQVASSIDSSTGNLHSTLKTDTDDSPPSFGNQPRSSLHVTKPPAPYISSADIDVDNADMVYVLKKHKPPPLPSFGNLETLEEGQRFLEAIMTLPKTARRDIALMAEFIIQKNSG